MLEPMCYLMIIAATMLIQVPASHQNSFGLYDREDDREAVFLIARQYWKAQMMPDRELLQRVSTDKAMFYTVLHQPKRPRNVTVRNKQEEMDAAQRGAD